MTVGMLRHETSEDGSSETCVVNVNYDCDCGMWMTGLNRWRVVVYKRGLTFIFK